MAKKLTAPKNSGNARDPKAAQSGRPVVYPKIGTCLYLATPEGDEPPMTDEVAKTILGWETEEQYVLRKSAEKPKANPEQFTAEFRLDVLCKDHLGNNIRCWANNTQEGKTNREFDEARCLQYEQDVLNRDWADSRNGEGCTFNGEAMIVGRTGMTISCQHRLIALIRACQLWELDLPKSKGGTGVGKWQDKWPERPTMECLVVTGVDESRRTVMTIDNVKPRSEADVIYTSEMFQKLNHADRKECSRMLASAVDFLWRRTGAGDSRVQPSASGRSRKTHSTSMDFVDHHKYLLACVKHLFEENGGGPKNEKGRAVSAGLGIGAVGQCAGVMYLMAATGTDINEYKNAWPPSERKIDFTFKQKAAEFWSTFPTDEEVLLAFSEQVGRFGSPLTTTEKFAMIALAWQGFIAHGDFKREYLDLSDHVKVDPETMVRTLIDVPGYEGIDIWGLYEKDAKEEGEAEANVPEAEEEEVADEEKAVEEAIEAGKREKQRKIDEHNARVRAAKAAGPKKPAPNNRMGGLAPIKPIPVAEIDVEDDVDGIPFGDEPGGEEFINPSDPSEEEQEAAGTEEEVPAAFPEGSDTEEEVTLPKKAPRKKPVVRKP